MIRAGEEIATTTSGRATPQAPAAAAQAHSDPPPRVASHPRDRVPRRLSLALALGATLAVVLLAAAPAGAASEIERIWSFNGGEVAVHSLADGKYEGVVVTPTTFDECPHQAGEHMWTNMTPQPDGSFWGFHQWLYEHTCAPNPVPGPTAWRVLQGAGGALSLEVCFSEPGLSQPTIAPSGAGASATFGCKTSAPTGLLPVIVPNGSKSHPGGVQSGEQISFAGTVLLPQARACVRRGTLEIRLRDPQHDPLKEVVIRIRRRKVADIGGVQRLHRPILLKGLPSGAYTLRITATTVLDQTLSGKRRYHSCKHGHGRRRTHRRHKRKG